MRRPTFTIFAITLLCSLPVSPALGIDAGDGADSGASSVITSTAGTAATVASIAQSVSPAGPIEPGVPVEVTLRIEHAPGVMVLLPDSYRSSRWELIDSSQQTTEHEGSATTVVTMEFGIFRPGETTLEAFDVTLSTVAGETVLTTEPITMKVVTALPAEPEPGFKDPRAPVPVWVDDYTLAWLGGGGAMLALLGLLAFIAARRRALMPAPPAPPRAAWEVALEKLSALAGDTLVERGEYMIFWVRLSEALREYLGRRYGFPPTELTTSEILGELDHVVWPNGLSREDVERFLRHCDRVKFGGEVPTVETSSEVLRRGFSIVELTRPRQAAVAPLLQAEDADDTQSSDASDADAAPAEQRWAPPEDYGISEDDR